MSLGTTGIQGYNASTHTVTFAATGVYTFTFTTSDGGTTVTIDETNKNYTKIIKNIVKETIIDK